MLINWLKTVTSPFDAMPLAMGFPNFGQQIRRIADLSEKLSGVEVALIGVDESAADAVRASLFTLAPPQKPQAIADLGNCRHAGDGLLIPLLTELLESGILPILIGGDGNIIRQQFLASQKVKQGVQVVLVDEQVRYHPEADESACYPLNTLLDFTNNHLFSLGLIGCQSHFIPVEVLSFLEKLNVEYVRLGTARHSIEEVEPVIRDGDMFSFHLQALRASEMPGQLQATPNGFDAAEACRIMRYAGMSDKLRSLSLPGFEVSASSSVGSQVVAQMIWYFLEGYFSRFGDYPITTDGLIAYHVQIPGLENPVVFWKSSKSGRWWMEVPLKDSIKFGGKNRLVPCTYEDYLSASHGDLSDRLIMAWNKAG